MKIQSKLKGVEEFKKSLRELARSFVYKKCRREKKVEELEELMFALLFLIFDGESKTEFLNELKVVCDGRQKNMTKKNFKK